MLFSDDEGDDNEESRSFLAPVGSPGSRGESESTVTAPATAARKSGEPKRWNKASLSK